MKRNVYLACGAMALALVACSEENGLAGTSTEPNTMALTSSSSVARSSSGSFDSGIGDLWNPSAGTFSINANRYAPMLSVNAKPDGHWKLETDSGNGGSSFVIWPTDLIGPEDEQTIIDSCNGICGTVVLGDYWGDVADPFVGVRFTLAKDDAGNPVPVDVSDWDGICMTYTSDLSPMLQFVVADSLDFLDKDYVFDYPRVNMYYSRDGEPITECRKWSSVRVPQWLQDTPEYWKTDAGVKAAKQLVGFKFIFSGHAGEYKFNIKSIGTYSVYSSSYSAAMLTSSDYPRNLWDGPAKDGFVKTALYANSSWSHLQNGEWFEYTDRVNGGKSYFDWYLSDLYDGTTPFDDIIDACDGMCCHNVVLDQGELTTKPFVLFGFDLAHNDSGVGMPVDISNWGGICVTYQSDYSMTLDLDPITLDEGFNGVSQDYVLENENLDIYKWPAVVLPKSSKQTTKCFKWNEFTPINLDKLPNPEKYRISGEEVVKRVVSIRFVIEDEAGNVDVFNKTGYVGGFNIKALGTYRD